MNAQTKTYRERQRRLMVFNTPRNRAGEPLCHLCGLRPGSQMHEIVNRNQTSSNEKALRLSFTQCLCSWLCPTCHALAPLRDVEYKLWQRNIRVYGYKIVAGMLNRLNNLLGFQVIVEFPEPTEAP